MSKVSGVYVITDAEHQSTYKHVELCQMAAEGGAHWIQFRDKKLSAAAMLPVIRRMQAVCKEAGCKCIVNDRVDLMMAVGADGVHVGQEDLPVDRIRNIVHDRVIIGGSASTIEEAVQMEKQGADYIGFGHIFKTPTKDKGYKPRGLDTLEEVVRRVNIPVMAIGGVTADNAKMVMDTGADGFCVSSAVYTADQPKKAVRELVEIFEQYK